MEEVSAMMHKEISIAYGVVTPWLEFPAEDFEVSWLVTWMRDDLCTVVWCRSVRHLLWSVH